MPDFCQVPTPAGPQLTPFTNTAEASDLAKGSTSVTIGDAPVCLSNSSLASSTGNEAGTLGGVASGTNKGAAQPVNFSFDVRINGANVVRNFDLFTLNDRNVPPFPIVQDVASVPSPGQAADPDLPKCPHCQATTHPGVTPKMGKNIGNSRTLGKNIFKGGSKHAHPWYTGESSLQAHHIICCEAMNTVTWAKLCRLFGYDIDRKQNGVMLPARMNVACQVMAPLHRSNHSLGMVDGSADLAYVGAVKKMLIRYESKAARGAYCKEPTKLAEQLDATSAEILKKVAAFEWALTADGRDYAPSGVGCGDATSIPAKEARRACSRGRRHDIRHPSQRHVLTSRTLSPGG
nr:PAAR-like domain-containing protein [Myxococcus sp. AM011]